jgi:hypothetical protein
MVRIQNFDQLVSGPFSDCLSGFNKCQDVLRKFGWRLSGKSFERDYRYILISHQTKCICDSLNSLRQ